MSAVDPTIASAFKSYLLAPHGQFMPPCSDRTFWGDARVQQQIAATRTVNGTFMLDWAKNKQPSRYMLVDGVPYKVWVGRDQHVGLLKTKQLNELTDVGAYSCMCWTSNT